jgi:hypothetical protein
LTIGHSANLRMITWQENISKNYKSGYTIDEILKLTNYTMEKSTKEFEFFLQLIKTEIKNNIPPSGANLLEKFYDSTLYKKS